MIRRSTGNEGVEQLTGKFFSKCGTAILFLPLVAALFFMAGCLEKSPESSGLPVSPGILKGVPEAQIRPAEAYPTGLQVDFDSDVSGSLFRVQGNLVPLGNGSFPYLLLKATLQKGGVELKSTKYLMIDVKSGGDHGFEIAKNTLIPPGNYDCTLEISGPTGTLACETRGCRIIGPWTEPPSDLAGVSGEGLPIGVADEESRSQQEEVDRQREVAGEEKETIKREDGAEKGPGRIEEEMVRTENQVLGSSGPRSQGSKPQVSGSQVSGSKISRVRVPEEGNVSSDHVGNSAQKFADTEAEKKYADTKNAGAKFVGSSSSKKYHRLDCRYALKIKADKRIYFSSEEDAKSQGYLPCKVCNP